MYFQLVGQANELYKSGEFKASAETFKKAFDVFDGKAMPNDRYNAACSYALSGQIDSAFYHLSRLADHPEVKYKNFDHITTDPDLVGLYDDDRWKKLIATVKANKEEAEKLMDKPLMAILDDIYEEDQKYRKQLGDIEKKYGRKSQEMKDHWKLIMEKDSINLVKIKKILDERGWLGAEVVGGKGNRTLFLVIQHSDLETQEKYLPMMREAVKNGKAQGSSLALLEDRVALGQGKRQIYGSQIGRDEETGEHYVLSLVDPENVDERRKEVGLPPIATYLNYWNATWDVEKHKARTARIEAEKKE